MPAKSLNRRQFLQRSALTAGFLAIGPRFAFADDAKPKRTAADQVTLGKTGIKLSRLGMGTGSNNGSGQIALGKTEFNSLIHYAYDNGITYFDCAKAYATFDWIGDAIKGLPREKLYIQSKVMGTPADILGTIDQHRKAFQTDYIDSLLIHLMVRPNWTEEEAMKRVMDGYNQAVEKKWIRAKGVSCHTLPALRAAVASNWTQVHLVRVNPVGSHMDNESSRDSRGTGDVNAVLEQIKKMHDEGHGVIGMKILGNGDFRAAEQREKSIRFAMSKPEIDAIVIGFQKRSEIDEAIQRVNSALAEAA
jgi:predicted aldo/keto reductase-like oxidoreductase